MRTSNLMLIAVVAMTAVLVGSATRSLPAATFTTVGVYDSVSNPNTVDVDLTGSLGDFTSRVANAFANDLGGVIDFATGFTSTGSGGTTIGTSFDASFGVSGASTLLITSDKDQRVFNNNTAGQVVAISDTSNLLPIDNQRAFRLTFGPVTGVPGNAILGEVGFTILSRNTFGSDGATASVTANFSGGGSQTLVSNISNVPGADDTFYHFAAPAFESIVSLDFNNLGSLQQTDNQARLPVDDLAFILSIVPEPSTGSIMLLGLTGWLGVRRRRRTV